jgi:hypothetical protein
MVFVFYSIRIHKKKKKKKKKKTHNHNHNHQPQPQPPLRLPRWHANRIRDPTLAVGCAFRLEGKSRRYELWTSRLNGDVERWDARGPLRRLGALNVITDDLTITAADGGSAALMGDTIAGGASLQQQVNPPMPNSLAASALSARVAVALGDGTVVVLQADSAAPVARWQAHGCPCANVRWVAGRDGTELLITTGTLDDTVVAWTHEGSKVGRWKCRDPINWIAAELGGGGLIAVALESDPPRAEVIDTAIAFNMAAAGNGVA